MDSEKLLLEITREQARVISEACELLARLHMGQLKEILWVWGPNKIDSWEWANNLIEALRRRLFPELLEGQFYPITSKKIPDEARVAFDLHQVLRHHLTGPKPKQGFPSVCHDEPRQTSQEQPLAVIKEISGKGD